MLTPLFRQGLRTLHYVHYTRHHNQENRHFMTLLARSPAYFNNRIRILIIRAWGQKYPELHALRILTFQSGRPFFSLSPVSYVLIFQASGHVLHSRSVVKCYNKFLAYFDLFEFKFCLYESIRAYSPLRSSSVVMFTRSCMILRISLPV